MSKCIYKFNWCGSAGEVILTGTFDNWGQSITLDKINDELFSKKLEFPKEKAALDGKIFFKFIVDGEWKTSGNYNVETDDKGNLNNFLLVEDLTKQKIKIKRRFRRNKATGEKELLVTETYRLDEDDNVVELIESIDHLKLQKDKESGSNNDGSVRIAELYEIKYDDESDQSSDDNNSGLVKEPKVVNENKAKEEEPKKESVKKVKQEAKKEKKSTPQEKKSPDKKGLMKKVKKIFN
ncbi:hypothetical protein KAFR_0A07480 [Kazachstania africana CBS 2517]|uniref:AMP-activated protein kinase glycogen-binding domain-containing protein n=1 Tax=Kazachstania africana (strain ATCC 22294 / BCRC 22015 / CBS 2517 / CECT 1963 / NBRC 1671 / NRRL Y-8276) TaxID=1071382 RepID=H2AP82_KAZAF|nr:hypothetical protein KAFR_0A07480 [Kazachstania africana CBS 2517]CCF56182.1 hypothetical protein KAFR_0A07480 [Kazachstania africana CBS 2517]